MVENIQIVSGYEPAELQETNSDPYPKTLASTVRVFKSAVTMNVRSKSPEFAWQSGFYDHVIRNEISYRNISRYISNNPDQWKNDTMQSSLDR